MVFPFAEKYRHQFIKLFDQRLVGIDVYHLNGKFIGAAIVLQGLKHVVAQMAIAAGIQNECNQDL